MTRTSKPSYYEVLGVSSDATSEQIDTAWKFLVRKHHPDRAAPGHRSEANARTAVINEARDTLRDPARRARYDRSLRSRLPNMRMSPDEALDAALRLRKARRTERLRVTGAGVAGIAAILYTARALKLIG